MALAISTHAAQRARILLGGDDPDRSGRLACAIAALGAVPSLACGVRQLVEFLDADDFDLVVVDLEPGRGGDRRPMSSDTAVSLVATIAERTEAPLVALGPGASVALAVVAQGVLTLPPDGGIPETARTVCALVPTRGNGGDHPRFVRHGPLELDVDRRAVSWRGAPVALTKLQFRLLLELARAQGALVSRADLHRAVYRTAPIDDGERVISHVRRIREKIEPHPSHPEFLLTVRGEGFRLADAF